MSEMAWTGREEELEAIEDDGNIAGFGKRSIGTFGGAMLIANSVAGPTIMLMPALVQEAGWLAVLLAQVIIASVSAGCGIIMLSAMRAIPGNSQYELRVEYTDLMRHYLPYWVMVIIMLSYHAFLCMTLMTYIIQSAHVMDFAFADVFGCAYGLELFPQLQVVCGSQEDSSTPFGDDAVIFSASFLVVAVVCTPFAVQNLDDNVVLQILAMGGLTVLTIIWLIIFACQEDFPVVVPLATRAQGNLIGTLLFNFAFMTTLPSWANEKRPDVSAGVTFTFALGYVVVIYTVVGIAGGMAWAPFFHTDGTLFSKLNASGSLLARVTVIAYPVLQNFSSIPVFSILIRYNLLSSGHFSGPVATVFAVVLPWVLSIPFYTGRGFAEVSEAGGFVASSICNFIAPVVVYFLAFTHAVRAATYLAINRQGANVHMRLAIHSQQVRNSES